jgi:hypothetical protein
VDLTDAILLRVAQTLGARAIATDDMKLSQVCSQVGLTAEGRIDAPLRQQIAAWELAYLLPEGLKRALRRVHAWLDQSHSQTAQHYWSHTGSGSHLP